MRDVFEIIIAVLIIYAVYKIAYYAIKRTRAMRKISLLKKDCGASITKLRATIASCIRPSGKPDLAVELGDTVYLVRFINGRSGRFFVHFASDRFFVTFSKPMLAHFSFVGRGRRYRVTGDGGSNNTARRRVSLLPPLEIPEKYRRFSEYGQKKVVPVLILNPAPNEISFVTEERTSIKLAFTGDELYGQKIFTASTFATYADREYRQSKYEYELWKYTP